MDTSQTEMCGHRVHLYLKTDMKKKKKDTHSLLGNIKNWVKHWANLYLLLCNSHQCYHWAPFSVNYWLGTCKPPRWPLGSNVFGIWDLASERCGYSGYSTSNQSLWVPRTSGLGNETWHLDRLSVDFPVLSYVENTILMLCLIVDLSIHLCNHPISIYKLLK